MTQEQWMERYKARFKQLARTEEGNPLTEEEIEDIATAAPFEDISRHFEDDPEGAADEEMSYWAN